MLQHMTNQYMYGVGKMPAAGTAQARRPSKKGIEQGGNIYDNAHTACSVLKVSIDS